MAQMRGQGSYGIGAQNPFGGSSEAETKDSSPLDAIRAQTSKIEDLMDTLSEPLKPYLPAIGRFLIVVTFIEDAIRIVTQWSDQLLYLHDYRHIPNGLTHLFLLVNVIAMSICSTLVIMRKYPEYAVGGLIGVVISQALGYGLIFDLNFFLRNLSVMGGLLMVLSDSWVRKTKAFAGLPQLEEKDRKMYFQLAGRVLLIFLFVGFVFSGEWSLGRIAVSLVGLVACVMVVVGFKAKFSAILLVVILSIFNILVNNFWTVSFLPPLKGLGRSLTCKTAPRAPPPQGLCQVRLLPDPLHRRRPAPPCQQRPRAVQHRREEEGLLSLPPLEARRKRVEGGMNRSSRDTTRSQNVVEPGPHEHCLHEEKRRGGEWLAGG
ncbi:putative COPII-coated vesicle protein SurF4/Erv29 [Podospora conica]|nr:putative COPII-coated vesicle protein SurF4/Erv29 [Schizothecium conicum]